jgi:hypothetical protein
MKQKTFKIKNTTLLVYKSIRTKSNSNFADTEPTTHLTMTTGTTTTGIFNK